MNGCCDSYCSSNLAYYALTQQGGGSRLCRGWAREGASSEAPSARVRGRTLHPAGMPLGPQEGNHVPYRTTSQRSGENGRVRGGIHHAGAAVRAARHDDLAARTGPITWPPGDASVLMDHATDWWWRYAHEPHGLAMTGVQALLWPHPTHVVRGSQSRDGQLRPGYRAIDPRINSQHNTHALNSRMFTSLRLTQTARIAACRRALAPVTAFAPAAASIVRASSHYPLRSCARPLRFNASAPVPAEYAPFARLVKDTMRSPPTPLDFSAGCECSLARYAHDRLWRPL